MHEHSRKEQPWAKIEETGANRIYHNIGGGGLFPLASVYYKITNSAEKEKNPHVPQI